MSVSGPINILVWLIVFIVIVILIIMVLKFLIGVLFIAPMVSATFPAYTETGSTAMFSVIDAGTSPFFSF